MSLSSLSLSSDDCGESPPISLNTSECKMHSGCIIKKEICKYCGYSQWNEVYRTVNIGVALFCWGKPPKVKTVNILIDKYCSNCNAGYQDACILMNIWGCCGKSENESGCSNGVDDINFECEIDE